MVINTLFSYCSFDCFITILLYFRFVRRKFICSKYL